MPPRHAKAIAHLSAADPVLGRWIAQAGPCFLTRERSGTHFAAVARSIIYQHIHKLKRIKNAVRLFYDV